MYPDYAILNIAETTVLSKLLLSFPYSGGDQMPGDGEIIERTVLDFNKYRLI